MHSTTIIAAIAFVTAASAVSCGGQGSVKVSDARTCADLLRGKSQTCTVPAGKAPQMCHQGTARVYGVSNNGQSQSASCKQVAEAVDRIIGACQAGGSVNGKEYTQTNNQLRVELHD